MAWRIIFGLAAVFNFIVGASLVFAPGQGVARLGIASAEPALLALAQLAGAMIVVFGVGYAMVAQDPAGGRQVARLGVIGKLAAFALGTAHYLAGAFPAQAFYAGCGDLVFALLFLAFLVRYRPAR